MAGKMYTEGIDGIGMSWNNWPRSEVEINELVIPLAVSVSPIHDHKDIPILPYLPLRCESCSCILNPCCFTNFTDRIWICSFSISEHDGVAELYHTTVEYNLHKFQQNHNDSGSGSSPSPVFLFVLDTCLTKEELDSAKSSLRRAISLLPVHALVGFVSFVFVFGGTKEITKEQLLDRLGLSLSAQRGAAHWGPGFPEVGFVVVNVGVDPGVNQFLLPVSDCEFTLNSIIEDLQPDPWPVQPGHRAARCTGLALSVAAGLLGACLPGTGARIIALVGGPCTEGPGTIVSKELSEPVCSHKDLDKDAAPHFREAVKFYENLAKQLVAEGQVLDLYASASDQVGIFEMKVAVERTGA
ncbi:hypothetical protein MKW98_018020 [Papaver atlanticum]|uniref:Protein transport protein SEC23 n=1 Tax=Papaver atlanticum TaxID=357466 RepID=A0AAD4TGR4_9MAGN|nr:hypothetical protein MKW98_018020 [Papaver atlanticum]